MRDFPRLLRATLVAAGAFATLASAESGSYSTPCQNAPINGISYCKSVDSISYHDIGSSGTYQDVILMDPKSCKCDTKPQSFSGTLSPLDEQMAIHFRGPLRLKQFGVYYPNDSPSANCAKSRVQDFKKHVHRRHSYSAPVETNNAAGSLTRTAYYHAEQQTVQGLTFLNNHGGQGSGVWDMCWGNSLSYASATCDSGSSKPEILSDMLLKTDQEFVIFTDQKCNGDCGYYREGIPAYRGFDGNDKIFVFEFTMPHEDGATGANPDMPSIWGLNAKIARTGQYSACSCWESGCGEFDMFEVLKDATQFVKSHFHAKQGAGSDGNGGGGSPDYFDRPCNNTVKAAVIFQDGVITIRLLPDSTEFSQSLDSSVFDGGEKSPSSYNVPT